MNNFTKNLYCFIAMVFVALCMTSCSKTFYQVYEVSSDNMIQGNNSLVYENEDCQVMYNLWSEDGYVSFIFMNKTDRDIFINMGQTFFIVNNNAYDYYVEATTSIQQSVQAAATAYDGSRIDLRYDGPWSASLYSYGQLDKFKKKVSIGKNISVKEQEIVCIPAKSYKKFCKCSISPSCYQVCIKNIDYPKTSAKVKSFTLETTPLRMYNRIAYGFTKNAVADKHIENDFWLSSITNYSEKAIIEKKKEKTDCYSDFMRNVYRFKIGGPDKFYIKYNRDVF